MVSSDSHPCHGAAAILVMLAGSLRRSPSSLPARPSALASLPGQHTLADLRDIRTSVLKWVANARGGTVMDGDRLRISCFSNRPWAEQAVTELRDAGLTAELDLSGAGGRPYAVIVSGCPEMLAMLRPMADPPRPVAAPRAARFEWCVFVNSIREP